MTVSRTSRPARVLGAGDTAVNEFDVEVPAGGASVWFSRCRYTEDHRGGPGPCADSLLSRHGEIILDFAVDDVDAEFARVDALGVQWVLKPATQPWGSRSMLFRDPDGHLVNVFSEKPVTGQR